MDLSKVNRETPTQKRFKWLSGDVNYKEYGGKWIAYIGNREYVIRELITQDDDSNMITKYRFVIYHIDLDEYSPEECKSACACVGMDQYEFRQLTDPYRAEILATSGYGIDICRGYDMKFDPNLAGNNFEQLCKYTLSYL